MLRIIGLTGGIACGKSHVSQVLQSAGVPVVDGDQLSRGLTAPGGAALADIHAVFGPQVFNPDGTLDRKALGRLVFHDAAELDQLNRLMRPLLRRAIDEALASLERSGERLCVMDMPLLYEEGLDRLCSRVWCVHLSRETQLNRLMERDHCTPEEALDRINSQMPVDEKAARADVVISTEGSLEETRQKVLRLWQDELELLQREEESHGT